MAMDEGGAERERQQDNERDCGQSLVGNGLGLTVPRVDLGAVPASVEKAMLEGPVLSQIVPTVVLLFPAAMAEPAYQRGGKGLLIQSRNPEPFVLGRFRLKLAPAVMVLCELLFGPHDPYGLRVLGGER